MKMIPDRVSNETRESESPERRESVEGRRRSRSSSRGRSRTRVKSRKSRLSPNVRIQVTLHKPLNWQLSTTSNSTHPEMRCVKKSDSNNSHVTIHSHSLSASDSLSFSISPSSTFSKKTCSSCKSGGGGLYCCDSESSKAPNNSSLVIGREGSGKSAKWKVRFTDLDKGRKSYEELNEEGAPREIKSKQRRHHRRTRLLETSAHNGNGESDGSSTSTEGTASQTMLSSSHFILHVCSFKYAFHAYK